MNLDELKSKALGFIEEIKSKVSRKKGGNSEDEYDDADFEEVTGELSDDEFGDINDGTEFDVDGDATSEIDMEDEYEEGDEDEEEEEEELDDEEAAKERQKRFRYGLIGLIVIYIGWELISPDEAPKQPPSKQQAKKRPQKKSPKKQKNADAPKEKKQEKKKEVVEQPKPVQPTPEEPTKIVNEPEEISNNEPSEPMNKLNETLKQDNVNALVDDPNAGMKDMGGIDGTGGEEDGGIIPGDASNQIKDMNIGSDLSKILRETKKQVKKSVDYTAPPDYTKFGRGLVYNCRGKHWACVDRKRWFECKGNVKYTEFYGKEKECHPVNVYSSMKDCRTMQLYNVNTNVETGFCQ